MFNSRQYISKFESYVDIQDEYVKNRAPQRAFLIILYFRCRKKAGSCDNTLSTCSRSLFVKWPFKSGLKTHNGYNTTRINGMHNVFLHS